MCVYLLIDLFIIFAEYMYVG